MSTKTINEVVVAVLDLFGDLESQDDRRTVLAMVSARYGLSQNQDTHRTHSAPKGKKGQSGGLDYYSNPSVSDPSSRKGKGVRRGGTGGSETLFQNNPIHGSQWSSSGGGGYNQSSSVHNVDRGELVAATNHLETIKTHVQALNVILPRVSRTEGAALPSQNLKSVQKRFTRKRVELGKSIKRFNSSSSNSVTHGLINSIQSFRIAIRDLMSFHLKRGESPTILINPFLGMDLESAKARIIALLLILKEDGDLSQNGFCLDGKHQYGIDDTIAPNGVIVVDAKALEEAF
jgi:hypothetical protein